MFSPHRCWALTILPSILLSVVTEAADPPTSSEPASNSKATDALLQSIHADIAACQDALLRGQGTTEYLKRTSSKNLEGWRQGAMTGWPEAQYLLGRCLAEGVGIQKDPTAAVGWYRKAAEQNLPIAQTVLGMSYEHENGVAQDESAAFQWYQRAAAQGDPQGQQRLADCYLYGIGTPRDLASAVRWYKSAADQNHVEAQWQYAACLFRGSGIERDQIGAIDWIRKAADQGHARAQNQLGYLYMTGQGVLRDPSHAIYWYQKAAAQGESQAQFNLGLNAFRARHWEEAVQWYLSSARQGHANAQFNLAMHYADGQGVSRDLGEAHRWLLTAAEQGHRKAQTNLGVAYEKGEGVARDVSEAKRWHLKAAEQGSVFAQINLITLHLELREAEDAKKAMQQLVVMTHKLINQDNAGPEVEEQIHGLHQAVDQILGRLEKYVSASDASHSERLRREMEEADMMVTAILSSNSIYEGRPGLRATQMEKVRSESRRLRETLTGGTTHSQRIASTEWVLKLWVVPLVDALAPADRARAEKARRRITELRTAMEVRDN